MPEKQNEHHFMMECVDATKPILAYDGKGDTMQYAMSYAKEIPRSFFEYGIPGLENQLLRLIDNIKYWRGKEAAETRMQLKLLHGRAKKWVS